MRRFSLLLLLVLAIPLAPCGGNGSTGGGTQTEAQDTDGGETLDGVDASRCATVARSLTAAATAAGQAITGAAEGLEESVQSLQAFAEEAPEEIRADLQAVVEGYEGVAQALEDADFDPAAGETPSAEDAAAIQAASESLNEAEFQEAVQRVTTWFREGCGQ